MNRKELIEKVKTDPEEALDLILDLVNQYCDETIDGKYKGMIGHSFMSTMEFAFGYLDLEAYRVPRQTLWDLSKDDSPAGEERK